MTQPSDANPPSPLRLRRLTLGLTQEAVAARAGLARQHLSMLERGHYHPTLATAQRLAAALESTVDALFES